MLDTPLAVLGNPDGSRRVGMFGIPYDTPAGIGVPGARYAPEAVRKALRWPVMRVKGNAVFDVEAGRLVSLADAALLDYGDVEVFGHDHLATLDQAQALMRRLLVAGDFPLAVGGDHSTTLPLFRAFHQHFDGPLGIIHVDAHLDLVDENAWQGRFSGSSQIRRALEMDRFSPTRLVQVGVRGFNYPDQFDYVAKNAVVHIPASQFHNMGASEAARQSMMVAAADQAHVFLTVDIDVLDPCSGPGSGADEPGGLSTSELLSFVREVAPSIDAMDVTEINPLRDRNDATSTVGAYLVMLTVVSRAAAG